MSAAAINIAINVGAVAVWCVCRYLFDRWCLREESRGYSEYLTARAAQDEVFIKRLRQITVEELTRAGLMPPTKGD